MLTVPRPFYTHTHTHYSWTPYKHITHTTYTEPHIKRVRLRILNVLKSYQNIECNNLCGTQKNPNVFHVKDCLSVLIFCLVQFRVNIIITVQREKVPGLEEMHPIKVYGPIMCPNSFTTSLQIYDR